MKSDAGTLVPPWKGGVLQRLALAYLPQRLATDWLYVSGLVAISLLLLFVGLGDRPLWDVDEGMNAVIAKNMVNSGDWIMPVFNGEPFMDKPPLVNWLGAATFSLLGFSEFAARLPSAMLGLGCILLTYFLGCKLHSRITGFISAVILATSLEFIIVSRIVEYDIPFTFLTTLSLYFFYSAFLFEQRRTAHLVGFYISVALAILTKGPLGLFLPSLAIGLFLIQQRRWSYLREMRLALGASIILLITAPWFVLMETANPGYLEYFIMNQHLVNFFGAVGSNTARHPEPPYYFLPVLLAGMFPWSLLLPQALIAAAKGRVSSASNSSILLLIWTVSIFVFFSLASSKLSTYILPIFPVAALLIGAYLVDYCRSERDAQSCRNLIAAASVGLMLIGSATVYVLVADPWIHEAQAFGIDWHRIESLLISLTAIATVALLMLPVRHYVTAFAMTSLIVPILVFFLRIEVMPQLDTYKSSKEIGLEYEQILGPGEKMIFANKELDSAMFYTNRESVTVGTEQDIRSILDSDRVAYLVLTPESDATTDRIRRDYYVIRELGNKFIIGNRSLEPDRMTAARGSGTQ